MTGTDGLRTGEHLETVVSGLGPPEDRISALGQEVPLRVRRPRRLGGCPAPPAARRTAVAAPPAAPPRPSSAAPVSGGVAHRRHGRSETLRRRSRSRPSGGAPASGDQKRHWSRASTWLYARILARGSGLPDAHPGPRTCWRKPPHKSPHAAHRCALLSDVSRALRDEVHGAPLWWAVSNEPRHGWARAAETWLRLRVTQEVAGVYARVWNHARTRGAELRTVPFVCWLRAIRQRSPTSTKGLRVEPRRTINRVAVCGSAGSTPPAVRLREAPRGRRRGTQNRWAARLSGYKSSRRYLILPSCRRRATRACPRRAKTGARGLSLWIKTPPLPHIGRISIVDTIIVEIVAANLSSWITVWRSTDTDGLTRATAGKGLLKPRRDRKAHGKHGHTRDEKGHRSIAHISFVVAVSLSTRTACRCPSRAPNLPNVLRTRR